MQGSQVCGFIESVDSHESLLRGILTNLRYIEVMDDDTQACIDVSKAADIVEHVLERMDGEKIGAIR